MFDFADATTSEYQAFARFVDVETNIPRKIAEIDPATFPYGFKAEVGPFRSYQKENLLSKDECEYLIWLAESTDEWLEDTLPFWKGRNLPFLTMLPARPWATEETYPLCVDIVKRIQSFINKSFGVEAWPDQIGIVRWPPGSWQMTHKDDVDGLDRVSGCVVFLNSDYEGGEPFYPYYDKMVKPRVGNLCLVMFVNGVPSRPIVFSCTGPAAEIQVDATSTAAFASSASAVTVGGSGPPCARLGDTLLAGGMFAGTITSGSSKVTVGG